MDANDYELRYWNNPVIQQMRQSFREITKKYSAITMLEIGCGIGLDVVHFAKTHPNRKIYGIDVSEEMVRLSTIKVLKSGCANIELQKGSVEDIHTLFPHQKFDIIYVFFGALNTVEDLKKAAHDIIEVLAPGGILVLTFVNKWYLAGVLIDLLRFRFSRAFGRFKTIWGGYSPTHFLPSHCYTPKQVKMAFSPLKVMFRKGYTIIHPAWYFINLNKKLGKLRRILWFADQLLDRTFLWKFGEYGLFVFKN
jgi:ubiquinone/menaquinone biosynthesis C-methylase UbiE